MLQRIQTVHMLIAALLSAVFAYLYRPEALAFGRVYTYGMWAVAAVLAVNIFLYRNRPLQMRLNTLVILAILVFAGLRVYEAVASGGNAFSGEKALSKKDVLWIIPVVSIVFVKLANQAIKRDDNLIKSVDRIR